MADVGLTTQEEAVLAAVVNLEDNGHGAKTQDVTHACLFSEKPLRAFAALETLFDLVNKELVTRVSDDAWSSTPAGRAALAPRGAVA